MTRRALNQILTGSPRSLLSIHPDTANYRSRISAKGTSIKQSDLLAIDRFVKAIYANNLRSLILECYPFAGENLSGSLTKLWHNSVPDFTNVGLTDLNYTPTAGITGNGTGYLNSNFIPSNSSLTNSSGSIGAYNRTNSFQAGAIAAVSDATNMFTLLVGWSDNLNYFDCYNQTGLSGRLTTGSSSNCQRLNIGSRVSLTDSRFFRDGNQITAIITGGGNLPTAPIFWLAYNNITPQFFSTKSLGFGFVGRGLTPAQVSTLTTLVNQLMTDLGRAV